MKVLVLGAGVAGICTAYSLARRGHSVTVVDRGAAVASEASFANGGQVSYNYVAPLAGPGVLAKLPRWLLNRDSPIRFRPRLDPDQWRWCLAFVLACNRRASRRTTEILLHLADQSRTALQHLMQDEALEFRYRPSGKLTVHSDRRSFDAAGSQAEFQRQLGQAQDILDADACVDREPALEWMRERLVGGIYAARDETGDCHQFCQQLAEILRLKYGVSFLLSTTVTRICAKNDRISHVVADGTSLPADAFVVALGAGSQALLRPLGIHLPIYPLKGYSLTVPITDTEAAPSVCITDYANRVAFARLGNELRVAGMVDIGVGDLLDPSRVSTLCMRAQAAFPRAADFGSAKAWFGFRPATPTGIPIVESARDFSNLVVNAGHGALGFTLAMASGEVAAAALAKEP